MFHSYIMVILWGGQREREREREKERGGVNSYGFRL